MDNEILSRAGLSSQRQTDLLYAAIERIRKSIEANDLASLDAAKKVVDMFQKEVRGPEGASPIFNFYGEFGFIPNAVRRLQDKYGEALEGEVVQAEMSIEEQGEKQRSMLEHVKSLDTTDSA